MTTKKKPARSRKGKGQRAAKDKALPDKAENTDLPPLAPDGLTPKQWLFVQEYIADADLNATEAAKRAGYSEDTAYAIGAENLRKPQIREAIQKAMNLRAERTQITADRVLTELGKIGFADVRKILTPGGNLRDLSAIDDDTAAAIQSVEVVTRLNGQEDADGNKVVEHVHKIRLADKKSSLELMGKHLKLFADRVEHTGPKGGPIPHAHVDMSDKDAALQYREFIGAV